MTPAGAMRVLVTGARGFVGGHLGASVARHCGEDAKLVLTSREAGEGVEALDVTDPAAITDALDRHAPPHVLNLAGVAAPADAGRDPDTAWLVHCDGVRRLADAILATAPDTVLVNAGTGLVYGGAFAAGTPVDEAHRIDPQDAYGASKGAGDLALGAAAARGLRCVRMRAFNHSGPGQGEDFVIPAFAAQIARIEAGAAAPILHVGDLSAARDFLDVRDVCDAYALALVHGSGLEPGTILNVASGVGRRIGDVLDGLLALSEAEMRVATDPDRVRPSGLPVAVGDAGRARQLLGWEPRIPFEQTLADVLNDWRARVGDARRGGPA
jgi:GDP-4-dehydro-6-deoxy-D-mannose reductase